MWSPSLFGRPCPGCMKNAVVFYVRKGRWTQGTGSGVSVALLCISGGKPPPAGGCFGAYGRIAESPAHHLPAIRHLDLPSFGTSQDTECRRRSRGETPLQPRHPASARTADALPPGDMPGIKMAGTSPAMTSPPLRPAPRTRKLSRRCRCRRRTGRSRCPHSRRCRSHGPSSRRRRARTPCGWCPRRRSPGWSRP